MLAVLLLAQPDLGTVVVLFGLRWRCCSWRERNCGSSLPLRYGHFSGCVADPRRTVPYPPVTAFWNPWEDPFGSGYQLTHR